MTDLDLEQRKARVLADECLMQRAGGKLVSNGVLHRLNSLMYDIIRHPEQAAEVFDLDYAEICDWASIPDYEEPATQAGWEEDDEGNIVKPCGKLVDYPAHKHGEANDFDYWDVLDEAGGARDVDERFSLGIDFDAEDDDDEAVWAHLSDAQKEELIAEYRAAHTEEADSWKDACEKDRLEPDYIEVYEYWLCEDYFARLLAEQGEQVIQFADMTIWCRTTTGQAICLDEVIRRILKEQSVYDNCWDVE